MDWPLEWPLERPLKWPLERNETCSWTGTAVNGPAAYELSYCLLRVTPGSHSWEFPNMVEYENNGKKNP